jgi:mannose-6-phosphate isomerase class I
VVHRRRRAGAELFVGLKRGVTRAEFEKKISDGSVADCFHRVPVRAGDTMFLPSGRVHAIGDGLVIFEIQQNSDTTYRVFDWNRVGLTASRANCTLLNRWLALISKISSRNWFPKNFPATRKSNRVRSSTTNFSMSKIWK